MATDTTALRRRLNTQDAGDEALLADLMDDAAKYVLGYTGQSEVPTALSGAVVELAAMAYNRLGMEGESAHAEGGVSLSVDDLPARLRALMNGFRVARVV